jgi:hypothetical protein
MLLLPCCVLRPPCTAASLALPPLPQADAIKQLQEERSQLSRQVEEGLSAQSDLEALRAQAGQLSGVTQELQQTRATLLELQAVARQLEQHRAQIAGLADQRAELEGALQQQAELTAEVSVLQRDYDEMLDKAQRALTLQEELPKLQVGLWWGVGLGCCTAGWTAGRVCWQRSAGQLLLCSGGTCQLHVVSLTAAVRYRQLLCAIRRASMPATALTLVSPMLWARPA